MLGADGKANGVRLDALLCELFFVELRVRGGSRVDNEGLHVCDVCEQRENFESVDERLCFLSAALDVEREDGSAAVREILLIKLVVRAVRQRRMVDAFDLRVLGEEIDNLQRVLYMAFNAQRERFKTCRNRNACSGASVAPVSRRRIARIFVTKAAAPTSFVKLMPW